MDTRDSHAVRLWIPLQGGEQAAIVGGEIVHTERLTIRDILRGLARRVEHTRVLLIGLNVAEPTERFVLKWFRDAQMRDAELRWHLRLHEKGAPVPRAHWVAEVPRTFLVAAGVLPEGGDASDWYPAFIMEYVENTVLNDLHLLVTPPENRAIVRAKLLRDLPGADEDEYTEAELDQLTEAYPLVQILGAVWTTVHLLAANYNAVHGDLLPRNLFFQRRPDGSTRPLVGDFGATASLSVRMDRDYDEYANNEIGKAAGAVRRLAETWLQQRETLPALPPWLTDVTSRRSVIELAANAAASIVNPDEEESEDDDPTQPPPAKKFKSASLLFY